jgi:amino-acid N-acetyltransferase
MFRDHVFVIAVDGSIVSHENFTNIVTDIAVLRSLSIKVVLVHGIGHQLVALAGEHNVALSDIQGEGITDAPTMSLAREAAALVSQTVLEHLTQAGLRCAITNAVRATNVGVIKGRNHLFTGKIEKVDAAILKSMLAQDILPLVTPIVCDREGQSLRVNSDHLAMELAVAMGASKLIYLTPFPGLQVDGVVKINLPEDELKTLLADKKTGRSLIDGQCVNGLPGSVFGQFAHCNAPAFFDVVNAFQAVGPLSPPIPPPVPLPQGVGAPPS